VATRAASLMLSRQGDEGLFAQRDSERALEDDRIRALPGGDRRYLQPQGSIGLALLDLHRVTGDPRWLDSAQRLGSGLAQLEDDEGGGFFATDDDSTAGIIGRRKPLEANAMAARFLFELSIYLHDDTLRTRAERAVRAVSTPASLEPEGRMVAELALALDWLASGAVEISVLGDPQDPRTRALRRAARRSYEPRKVLHHEAPGRYPDPGHPAIYVCSDDACSTPIDDPGRVKAEIAKFAGNRAE